MKPFGIYINTVKKKQQHNDVERILNNLHNFVPDKRLPVMRHRLCNVEVHSKQRLFYRDDLPRTYYRINVT